MGRPSRYEYDIRTDCDDEASSISCDTCGSTCRYRLDDVPANETLFVVATQILTAPAGSGDVDVTFTLQPFLEAGDACEPDDTEQPCAPEHVCQDERGDSPVCGTSECGDGFIGFGMLECDDGNTTNNDGCSDECIPDVQGPGADTCADPTPLALVPTRFGEEMLAWGSAAGDFALGSDASASCATASGPEAVYSFELAEQSIVELESVGADVLSVHAADGDCGSEVECVTGGPTALALSLQSLAPGTYLIVLDRIQPTAAVGTGYELSVVALAL